MHPGDDACDKLWRHRTEPGESRLVQAMMCATNCGATARSQEYSSPIWNPHTFSQVKSLERVQHSAARFVKNDYRRNTNPADLITALGWPTLERRRIIKQATTFYKILNNIIEITPPPPGLLTRSRTRGQYIAHKCRINAMVFLFYPRAIRIWNMIPPKITNIKNPK